MTQTGYWELSVVAFFINDILSNRRLGQLLSIDLLEEKRRKIVRKIKLVEAEELLAKKSSKSKKSVAAKENVGVGENVESVKIEHKTSNEVAVEDEDNGKGQGRDETEAGKAEEVPDVEASKAVEKVEVHAEAEVSESLDQGGQPKAGQDQVVEPHDAAQPAEPAQTASSASPGQDISAKNWYFMAPYFIASMFNFLVGLINCFHFRKSLNSVDVILNSLRHSTSTVMRLHYAFC